MSASTGPLSFKELPRNSGAGFAAAFAEIGAVATAFLFPILLVAIGTRFLLYGLIAASVPGAVVTSLFRIETAGVNLDQLSEEVNKSETAA